MPYSIRKLPNKELYRVYNSKTKAIHSYATTLENAKKQVRLLYSLEKEGGALSMTEKREIATEIKPITEEKAIKSYGDLEKVKDNIPPPTSRKGNEFVDFFTFLERLETEGNKGISFFDFWENKSLYLKKNYVKNLVEKLTGSGNYTLLKALWQVFGVYFGAPQIFKPVIAMNVYARYRPTSVLDFTMGWGGRLLAAAVLNVPKYTGIDLNANLEEPYRHMEATLKELGTTTDIKLIFKDALKVDYSKLDYDMVFTSPPYYNVEIYRGTNRMTETEWNETFYIPIFTKTWKHLKLGGHYIINVPAKVYKDVLINLFGEADELLPLGNKRAMSKKLKQAEYTEYMYVWRKEKKGGSIETDKFATEGIVSLPEFRSVKLNLPTYMYKRLPDIKNKDGTITEPTYRYKLVIPITSSRNLSSRKKETSLNINQKPVIKPMLEVKKNEDEPNINEFSPEDKIKIQEYYYKVKANERKNPDDIDKDEYKIVQRGFPLPCDKPRPKKPKPPKVPKEKKVKEPKEKKPRGRPKKVRKLQVEGDEDEDLYANIVNPQVEVEGDPFAEEGSVASFPSTIKSSKSKASTASTKSKASSKASESSIESDTGSISNLMSRYSKIKEQREKEGLGIKNNISSNNKMANSWVQYVKEYAAKNGMSYRDALRDPKCKAGYKKGSGVRPMKKGMGVIDESEFADQALLADAYNMTQLGANAGKKYISL